MKNMKETKKKIPKQKKKPQAITENEQMTSIGIFQIYKDTGKITQLQ